MAIRPSVPSEGDDHDDDRADDRADDRERDRRDDATGDGASGREADVDRNAEPWSPTWRGEIETSGMAVPPEDSVRFHADVRFMWMKFVVAVIFIVTPIVAGTSITGLVVGLLVGVGLAVYGLRDVVAPVRLAVDRQGATVVTGYAGKRRLAWSQIERVRLDRRSRYGGRQELLEIDAGESLHFFSRYDLGMAPSQALDLVRAVRPAA